MNNKYQGASRGCRSFIDSSQYYSDRLKKEEAQREAEFQFMMTGLPPYIDVDDPLEDDVFKEGTVPMVLRPPDSEKDYRHLSLDRGFNPAGMAFDAHSQGITWQRPTPSPQSEYLPQTLNRNVDSRGVSDRRSKIPRLITGARQDVSTVQPAATMNDTLPTSSISSQQQTAAWPRGLQRHRFQRPPASIARTPQRPGVSTQRPTATRMHTPQIPGVSTQRPTASRLRTPLRDCVSTQRSTAPRGGISQKSYIPTQRPTTMRARAPQRSNISGRQPPEDPLNSRVVFFNSPGADPLNSRVMLLSPTGADPLNSRVMLLSPLQVVPIPQYNQVAAQNNYPSHGGEQTFPEVANPFQESDPGFDIQKVRRERRARRPRQPFVPKSGFQR